MSGEEEDSKSGAGDSGAGEPEENSVEMSDLFRSETAISWLDLRLDVADGIVRSAASEDITLAEDRDIRVTGTLTNIRGSRDITVGGDYTRIVSDDGKKPPFFQVPFKNDYRTRRELFALSGAKITEVVRGGVRLHAKRESEAIVGGGYASQNVGPFLKIAGMYDVMCWGGWTEADVARNEVADAVIKAYYVYAHAAGLRVASAYHYFDDFVQRIENFTTLNDNTTLAEELDGPGSGEILES